MKQLKVRITFTEKVLGSQPADPEIYSSFIASNAPDAKTMKEEIEEFGKTEYEEKKMTVFPRVDGVPCLLDYQVKGFFKDSCSALQRMKGDRTCLANSETLPEGTTAEFIVEYPDTYDKVVKEWLNYGKYKGISQWRNAGWGRFTWEEI